MVNKERVKLLVDALRSGEYKQGRGHLTKGDYDCCLGVACKVAIKNGVDLRVSAYGDQIVTYDGTGAMLPHSAFTWYGFTSADPIITIGDRTTSAAGHNDEHNTPFDKIADGFEAML